MSDALLLSAVLQRTSEVFAEVPPVCVALAPRGHTPQYWQQRFEAMRRHGFVMRPWWGQNNTIPLDGWYPWEHWEYHYGVTPPFAPGTRVYCPAPGSYALIDRSGMLPWVSAIAADDYIFAGNGAEIGRIKLTKTFGTLEATDDVLRNEGIDPEQFPMGMFGRVLRSDDEERPPEYEQNDMDPGLLNGLSNGTP